MTSQASASSSSRDLSSLAVKYAAGAALVGIGQAYGAVIVTPVNQTWQGDSTYFKFQDFLPNATSVSVGTSNHESFDMSVRFASPAYGVLSAGSTPPHGTQFMSAFSGGFGTVALKAYAPSDAITGASNANAFFRYNNAMAPGWSDQTTAFVGYSLTFGGNTYYGWFDLTVNLAQTGLTVSNIAINTTPGERVSAGAIPEPAHSVLAFAGGALGIAALRRRRREAALVAA